MGFTEEAFARFGDVKIFATSATHTVEKVLVTSTRYKLHVENFKQTSSVVIIPTDVDCVVLCVCVFAGPSPSKLPASREQGFPALYEWLKAHNAEFDKASQNSSQTMWHRVSQCSLPLAKCALIMY